MKPYVYGPKFMWNLDSSVGKGGSNHDACDVAFIQWYYVLAADFHLTDEDRKIIYRKVQTTGICNGSDADPLVQAILAHQRFVVVNDVARVLRLGQVNCAVVVQVVVGRGVVSAENHGITRKNVRRNLRHVSDGCRDTDRDKAD